MRVQVGISSLHANANSHYGTGKGTTMLDLYQYFRDKKLNFFMEFFSYIFTFLWIAPQLTFQNHRVLHLKLQIHFERLLILFGFL